MNGHPLLLVHGLASSFEHNWRTTGWVDILGEEGREIIGVDLPGHGTSSAQDPARVSPAAAAKRVYLAPRLPFGWIDQPPSINRAIGLRWIAGLLYPDKFPEDLRVVARDFVKLFYQIEPDDAALDRILTGAQSGRAR